MMIAMSQKSHPLVLYIGIKIWWDLKKQEMIGDQGFLLILC